jgi:hypothetical protein
MSGPTSHRLTAFTLALSVGALSVAPVEAAQSSRSDRARTGGSAIWEGISIRTLLQAAVDSWWGIAASKDSPPPNHPGNHPPGQIPSREGTSVCPHGGNKPPGNP